MLRLADIARTTAIIISGLYMVILFPHLGSIGADHFRSIWFLGGLMVVLAWIPLLMLNRFVGPEDKMLYVVFSVTPLLFIVAYISALFALA